MKIVHIFSRGDPRDPKSWSGTPYNLVKIFSKLDCLGDAVDWRVGVNKVKIFLFALISYIYYRGSKDLTRGKFLRALFSKNVYSFIQKNKAKNCLYLGTLCLPFAQLPKDCNHYLYCDSTWNLWSNFSTEMGEYSQLMLEDAELLEKKSYEQMTHIFVISQYVKKNLIEHYGIDANKITVVGSGLGVIKPYHGEKDYGNGKILFVAKGRFADKGGPLVLEAFKLALEFNPKLELIIVGQNEYVDIDGISNLRAYGFIPLQALQALFEEASLFLMPAVNEPWGLVYLEALACRMPIVGLNRNSFPEISNNGAFGYILDYPNPIVLSEIILDAFSNPSKLESIGNKGQDYCLNNFSWNESVNTMLNVIPEYVD